MDVILTGSVAFDYLMQFPGYFRDHILPDKLHSISLSFLVESMVRRRGGVAPNIAYTMALLGQPARVMATVGEDFEEYRAWLEEKGVDTRLMRVIPNEMTASFFCNTDRANAQIASFYPGAMGSAAQLSFHELEGPQPSLVVISPNAPEAMIGYVSECQELGIPYVYDPSQQIVRLEPEIIRSGILGAHSVFVNDYEFGLIEKATGLTLADVLQNIQFLVITRGEAGADIYVSAHGLTPYHVPIVPPSILADPTGVGDAFRAGFLTGYARGFEWETCGQMGSLAATYCLENYGTQAHDYTIPEFISRFRGHFDDHGQLEKLIQG